MVYAPAAGLFKSTLRTNRNPRPVLAPRSRRHKAGRESYNMGTGTIGNGVRGKTLTCGLNLRTVAL